MSRVSMESSSSFESWAISCCVLRSVFLLIALPLAARGLSGGDDANNLISLNILAVRVGDQQDHDTAHQAQGLPSLLASLVAVPYGELARVFEDSGGSRKAHTVLGLVGGPSLEPTRSACDVVATIL